MSALRLFERVEGRSTAALVPKLRPAKSHGGGAAVYILRPPGSRRRGVYRVAGVAEPIFVGLDFTPHSPVAAQLAAGGRVRGKLLPSPRTRFLQADPLLAATVALFWPGVRWGLSAKHRELGCGDIKLREQVFLGYDGDRVVAVLAPLWRRP